MTIKSEHERFYDRDDWRERRMRENNWNDWYSGKNLAEAEGSEVDEITGERIKLYPLRINPIAKTCRIHRSVLFGMPDNYDVPLVQLVVKPAGKEQADRNKAFAAQEFLRRTLVASDASSLFDEAGLLTQVHGGHVFQAVWDEHDDLLPYRIRVVSYPSQYFYPVYDQRSYWNLREAYIGYYISGEHALNWYGIDPHGKDQVLYMEHWTPNEYVFTVNGIVPQVDGYGKLQGTHGYGRVPIVYIPHYRDGDFFGRSQVEDIIALTIEKNSRSADRGDLVNDYAHPTLVSKNITKAVEMITVERDDNGKVTRKAINLGNESASPNAPKKELDYLKPPPVPPEVLKYDDELWAEICRQADVASVAMGDDDTSSGRITGPATAYRMWPTMSHTLAERVHFSTGLRHLADIIFRIASRKVVENVKQRNGIEMPKDAEDFASLEVATTWNPQIPLDVTERATMLNARLQAKGISLYDYLVQMGEQDVDAELERIWADREREAQIEIKVTQASRPPTPTGGEKKTTHANQDRK
jgi:hypothetical protein